MRFGVVVSILLSLAFGAIFGALNSERIIFDFHFFDVHLPKGAALLAALLLGWILGGLLVWFARVRRLRAELRRCQRQLREAKAGIATAAARDATPGDA